MIDDKLLLSEFKKAIHRSSTTNVVDLDNKFNIRFDFEIQRIEDILKFTGPTIPPNRWSYFRILLVKEGSGDFITGIYKFKAPKNTLVVFPSRIITSSKNWAEDTEGYIVLFNIDFFLQNNFPHKYIEDKKILNSSIRPYIYISDEQSKKISAIFETILKEKKSIHKNKDELIALKIIELLISSERLFAKEQNFEENLPSVDIIKRFIDLTEANVLNHRSVSFYAKQLNVHPNYLNALIKKHTGITAKESIQNRLLIETKYLLHSTTLSIKEISNQMGFNDPNYFTVFFKRFEKISPANYRSSFI
ncbi:MAG: helix-turn-helix domain-containing protein [Ginsengibacter sp.]